MSADRPYRVERTIDVFIGMDRGDVPAAIRQDQHTVIQQAHQEVVV